MLRIFCFRLTIALLFILLPNPKTSAQAACLGLALANPIEIDAELDASLEGKQADLYTFDVHANDVMRFDVESSGNVTFTFYKPIDESSYEPIEFSEVRADDELFSTVYWFRYSTQVCLRVYNHYRDTADYEFELSRLRFRNGQLSNSDNLTDALAYNTIGNYYYWYTYYQSAYDSYARAIELDDRYSVIWGNFAAAAYQLGLYDEGIEHGTRAIEIDAENAHARGFRAASYSALGDYGSAIEDYEIAEDIQADEPYWPFILAIQYVFNGDDHDAVRSMERYVRVSSSTFEAYWLALVEYNAGDYEDASRHFEDALEEYQPTALNYLWLGLTYRSAGRDADAEAAFAEADELIEANVFPAEIHFYSAFAELSRGNYRESQAFFEEVLLETPLPHQNYIARFYLVVLANCFPDEGRYANMRDWFNGQLGLGS